MHNSVIDAFESQLAEFTIDRSSLRLQQLIADGTVVILAMLIAIASFVVYELYDFCY